MEEEGGYITISCTQLTKRVNKPLKNVTRKQQRHESPMVTLTLHATKYDLFFLITIGNIILFLLGNFNFFHVFFPGGDIPKAFINKATSGFFISKLLAIFIVIGAFVGSLVGCCMCRRKMTLVVSLVLIACYGAVMGSLTLAVKAFDVVGFAVTYCFLFGLLSGKQTFLFVSFLFCFCFTSKNT